MAAERKARSTHDLASDAILVLGAPRSGTTWLGKIFDSHPHVLYRHEPDYTHPAPAHTDEGMLRATVNTWIGQHDLRSAGKFPFFRKSWESAPGFALRYVLSRALITAAGLPAFRSALAQSSLPDAAAFDEAPGLRAVWKSVAWCQGAGVFARSLPNSRTILLLRHPCGQIDSLLRGARQRRFDLQGGADMPFDEELTIRFAAGRGVSNAEFQTLSDAAKYAWAWLAFNETAFAALAEQPNARIVRYEDLCSRPEAVTRDLFTFTGLDWSPSTANFLAKSTRGGRKSRYYSVFQDTIVVASRWREDMAPQDQAAVGAVVRSSALSRFWPEDHTITL
jgi:hypothetical protein